MTSALTFYGNQLKQKWRRKSDSQSIFPDREGSIIPKSHDHPKLLTDNGESGKIPDPGVKVTQDGPSWHSSYLQSCYDHTTCQHYWGFLNDKGEGSYQESK